MDIGAADGDGRHLELVALADDGSQEGILETGMVAQHGCRDLRHVLGQTDRQGFRQAVVVAELPGDRLTHRGLRILGETHQDIGGHFLGGARSVCPARICSATLLGGIDAVGDRRLVHQARDIGQRQTVRRGGGQGGLHGQSFVWNFGIEAEACPAGG